MSNKAPLGGSPLGLIGMRSTPLSGGMSTFNAGKTRNVNVSSYNNNLGLNHPGSLFTGKRSIRAWPTIKGEDITGTNDVQYGSTQSGSQDTSSRKTLHNDSIYDTSILNIITKLANTKASLRPADFAYLKNVGVYPNNRLMIARRFASPSPDNIMINNKNELGSFATLISWVPEGQDYLDITFGEEWEDTREADFKGILTSLGEDIKLDNLGGIGNALGNAVPLPGFTEILQRNFLAKMGLIEDSSANMIPAGNPNLIKSSRRRKTVGYSEAGSGLKCNVNIKMICEYELKFISGIDPTIVWMDILGMITRFGTSNSEGYGLSKKVSSDMIRWANNPNELIKDVSSNLQKSLIEIQGKVSEIVENITSEKESKKEEKSELEKTEEKNKLKETIENTIKDLGNKITSGLVQKYRVRILSVVNALSGLPSTPWHITIGNPLRPTFCSGDMLVEDVNLKLGPTLAFNDLPSNITVEFTLKNARPWGLQEIMAKFNSGYLRTVDVQKTFYETAKRKGNDGTVYTETPGLTPFEIQKESEQVSSATSSSIGSNSSGTPNTNNNSSQSINSGTRASGNGTTSIDQINSDANSISPIKK